MKKQEQKVSEYEAEIERLNNEYNKAFARLKSQQQEIERLKTEIKQSKIEAVKEFAEKVKEKALSHCRTINCYECKFIETTIDDILEEYEK